MHTKSQLSKLIRTFKKFLELNGFPCALHYCNIRSDGRREYKIYIQDTYPNAIWFAYHLEKLIDKKFNPRIKRDGRDVWVTMYGQFFLCFDPSVDIDKLTTFFKENPKVSCLPD